MNKIFKCFSLGIIVIIWLLSLTHIAFNFESLLNLSTTLDIITLTCLLVLFLIHTLTPLYNWVFNPVMQRLRKYPTNQVQTEIYNDCVRKYCNLDEELTDGKIKFKFSDTYTFEMNRDEVKSNATVVHGNNNTSKSLHLLFSFLVSLFILVSFLFFCGLLNSDFKESTYLYFYFFSLFCLVICLYSDLKIYGRLKKVAPKAADWFNKLVNALPAEEVVDIYNTKGINLNKIRVEKVSLTVADKEVE